jgi:hypothetical protein
MEQLMWIGIGIVAGVGLLVLIPVLVIGGWFIVVTLIMGLCDKAIGLLEQGWKTISRRSRVREKPVLRVAEHNAILSKELASASVSPRGSS